MAARFSSASVVEAFVKAGAKVDAQDDEQKTPLQYAAQFTSSEDVIRELSRYGSFKKVSFDQFFCSYHNSPTRLQPCTWQPGSALPQW